MSVTKIAAPVLAIIALLGLASVSRAQLTPAELAEPKASLAVQKLLDQAIAHLSAQRPAEALAAADRALAAAHTEEDGAGEAQAQRFRAQALSALKRSEEALSAWYAAATAWARIEDGPGQIEALAEMSIELDVKQPQQAAALRAKAMSLGQSESRRPLEAAHILHAVGQTYFDRGALSKAHELWLVAVSIRERHAPGSLDTALTLNSLGIVVKLQGDVDAAGEYYRKALAIREEKTPNSLGVAGSLNNLGNLAKQQGDLGGAREYLRRALAIRKEKVPNSLDVAECLNSLGVVAKEQGDLVASRAYHRKALAIREERAPHSLHVASSLSNLGTVAGLQGDLASARAYFRGALAIQEEEALNRLIGAISLNNLGVVALHQGDLAAAREYHRKALAIRQERAPNSLELATSLNNLGSVALEQGDLLEASEYHKKALAIRQEKAPNSLQVAMSLVNLGLVARQQGDLTAARDYLQRALVIQEEKAPDSLDVANSLQILGEVARLEGHSAAAREHHRKALAIQEEKAPNSLDEAKSRYNLGELAEKQGDWAEAKEHFGRAWQLVQNQTGALSGDEARQAFDKSTQYYAAKLIRSQLALGDLQAAFTTLEESRAQALQQLLLEKQGLAKAVGSTLWSKYQVAVAAQNRGEQAASQASVAELLAQRDVEAKERERAAPELMAKAQEAKRVAAKKSDEAQSAYTQARVKAEAMWTDIKRSLPQTLAPVPLSLEQASQALPPRTLFVAFSVGEKQTDVFLLRAGLRSESSLPLLAYTVALSHRELRRGVEQLRLQVINPSRRTAGTTAGRSLFVELFPTKARKEIAGAERLLISPDGPLWDVPFAALVTNASGAPRYLGAAKAITYTPSLALFAQSRSESHRALLADKLSTVVVGHPIFNRAVLASAGSRPSSRRGEMERSAANVTSLPPGFGERSYLFLDGRPPEPLPETEREAAAVAGLYGSTPLLREQATEAALRQQIETADVVHLATHGYLHPVRAMSSGVLLTVPEREPEPGDTDNDGALQAWEIYSQLKLKADLVVLSACETGRGQEVKGEGLVGLTRALQYAGARSIVASQWKVADQSTAKLMVAFHRFLRQGVPKDEALRQAMAQVRENPATSHPYFWAPFILVGDSDNSLLATFRTSR